MRGRGEESTKEHRELIEQSTQLLRLVRVYGNCDAEHTSRCVSCRGSVAQAIVEAESIARKLRLLLPGGGHYAHDTSA
jgi:hypothetical protein